MLEGLLLLGGLPFPPVPRALPAQVAAMEALREAAPAFSANATPALLERLDSVAFREALLACCSASGWATRPAAALLDELRENVYSSELVHTFDGSRYPDMSIEIGLYNESGYFPSLWQLLFLGYYVRARALRPDSTTSGLPGHARGLLPMYLSPMTLSVCAGAGGELYRYCRQRRRAAERGICTTPHTRARIRMSHVRPGVNAERIHYP